MEFVAGNEAHPTYHTFSALIALSSIISRRVWIDMGYFKVYPNLYVVLVGPPGNRKTTAMSTCKGLIRSLKDIPFSAECVTKEKLVEDMATYERVFQETPTSEPIVYTPLTVCVTELSQFLGASSAHMVDFLTTVYDQDFYDLKTKNKGCETITGPHLVLLACTTPAWITARLRDDVISGGFSRRAIFVYEVDKGARIPFPEITTKMKSAWDRVQEYSLTLMRTGGAFFWDPAAKKFFEDWYNSMVIPKDPIVSGFYESKHIQLIKIAMLIAIAESTDLVLKKHHLECGLELLNLVEVKLPRVFEGLGRNELNSVSANLLELVSSGPVSEKDVQRFMYREANGEELYRVIQHLIKTERIERLVKKGVDGAPDRIYLATTGTSSKSKGDVESSVVLPSLTS